MAEMLRVNTRISSDLNNWIEKYSKETGYPKSTVIMLALDNYKQQKEAIGTMGAILDKLERLEKKIEK